MAENFADGNYLRVLNAKQETPSKLFTFFLDKIKDSLRIEMANSAEKSFKSIKINDAIKLLFLKDEAELITFVEQRKAMLKETNIIWMISNGRLYFESVNLFRHKKKKRLFLPTE